MTQGHAERLFPESGFNAIEAKPRQAGEASYIVFAQLGTRLNRGADAEVWDSAGSLSMRRGMHLSRLRE